MLIQIDIHRTEGLEVYRAKWLVLIKHAIPFSITLKICVHKYQSNHIWNSDETSVQINIVLKFWLGETHKMFTTPYLMHKNG
jgi:hypothetical protein